MSAVRIGGKTIVPLAEMEASHRCTRPIVAFARLKLPEQPELSRQWSARPAEFIRPLR